MYSYQQCWFYQCPNPECNCVGITNDVVMEHRYADGVVQCPRCTRSMERLREALLGEYDPDDQEELARWATAFKVTFMRPWEVDQNLRGQPVAETSFLTEEDAARILGITVRAIRQLVKTGKLRSIRLTKRKHVFTCALIEEFLRRETGSKRMALDAQAPDPRSLSPKNSSISLEESRSLLKDLRRDMSPPDTDDIPIQMSRRR